MTLTRRNILAAGAGLIASPAFAQTGFDWQRYKGQTIEVLLAKSPRSDLFQRDQKEFEALTGIKVGAEQIPEQQQRQKMVVEFASGRAPPSMWLSLLPTCRNASRPRATGSPICVR